MWPLEHLTARWMHVDNTTPFAVISLVCVMLSLYVMQSIDHDESSLTDPKWAQWTRRAAFVALIVAMMWRVSFTILTDDMPTPPEFLAVAALTVMFGVRAVILRKTRAHRLRVAKINGLILGE